jgi:hypothetical protein
MHQDATTGVVIGLSKVILAGRAPAIVIIRERIARTFDDR